MFMRNAKYLDSAVQTANNSQHLNRFGGFHVCFNMVQANTFHSIEKFWNVSLNFILPLFSFSF